MTRFSHAASLGLAFLGLAACSAPPAPTPAQATISTAPGEQLSRIVDRFWDEPVPLGVPLSPQFMADSLALERRYLDEIRAHARQFSTKLLSRKSRVAECAIRNFKNGKNTIKPRTLRKLTISLRALLNEGRTKSSDVELAT